MTDWVVSNNQLLSYYHMLKTPHSSVPFPPRPVCVSNLLCPLPHEDLEIPVISLSLVVFLVLLKSEVY